MLCYVIMYYAWPFIKTTLPAPYLKFPSSQKECTNKGIFRGLKAATRLQVCVCARSAISLAVCGLALPASVVRRCCRCFCALSKESFELDIAATLARNEKGWRCQ